MNNSTFKILLLVLIALGGSNFAMGCNLSAISLCGVYKTPLLTVSAPTTNNDSMICLSVCNGYGRTGTNKGADNDTRSISFGWYTHRSGFVIRAFTPANVTSGRGFTNCTMPGSNIGPQGAPYNSQGTILYVDPGYYGTPPCVTQPFGCVTNTTLCGNVAQQCITYRFQVNKIPDSVRVFGVEGGGNPVAGCYPDADMKIRFTPLAIDWGTVEALNMGQSVKVKWSTLSERNTDLFLVQRSIGAADFSDIGSVTAAGMSDALLRYEYMDLTPMPGINRYRIMQVDKSGSTQNSLAVEVNFAGPDGLQWGAIGPNPATDFINLSFFNDRAESMTLYMHDLKGKSVIERKLDAVNGNNALRIALENVDPGVYFITLQGQSGKLTKKVVKL